MGHFDESHVSGHDFSRAKQALACVRQFKKTPLSLLPQAGAQLPLLERSALKIQMTYYPESK